MRKQVHTTPLDFRAHLLDVVTEHRQGKGNGLVMMRACEFRFNPAGDSDLMSATVPI